MRRTDSLEKTLMLGGMGAGGEGNDRGWDSWMASPTRWTWVWVNSGRWWWTGKPGVLRFMGSQRVGHDWATELNWTNSQMSFSWIRDRNYSGLGFGLLTSAIRALSHLSQIASCLITLIEGNGTPLQYSCLENLMDGGAWCAAVHGVARSWTQLSDFTFTFHFHALEKEMAAHSSVRAWRIPGECSCLEDPRGGGAWRAA